MRYAISVPHTAHHRLAQYGTRHRTRGDVRFTGYGSTARGRASGQEERGDLDDSGEACEVFVNRAHHPAHTYPMPAMSAPDLGWLRCRRIGPRCGDAETDAMGRRRKERGRRRQKERGRRSEGWRGMAKREERRRREQTRARGEGGEREAREGRGGREACRVRPRA
eukprot:3299793-Rhodomonas_salina.2